MSTHIGGTTSAGRRRQAGTTFAELMLATLIIGTTVVGASSSLSQTATVYHFFTDGPHEALMLANEIHEAAIKLPWTAAEGAESAFGDGVVTLFDLDEQEYNPPRSASYDLIVSHPNWTQEVAVQHVDMDNPSQVVDPGSFGGETLVRLEVTIFSGEIEVDTFHWWMSEPEKVE